MGQKYPLNLKFFPYHVHGSKMIIVGKLSNKIDNVAKAIWLELFNMITEQIVISNSDDREPSTRTNTYRDGGSHID